MSVTAVPLRPIRKGTLVKLWLGIGVAAAVAAAAAYATTSSTIAQSGTPEQFLAWHAKQAGVVTTASGLQYQVLEAGEGAKPTDADVTLINYKGALRDGTVFDQNEKAPLPVNGVVPGFAEGLKLMPKGAKYRLWIPPQLGYGERAQGDAIPANSVLVFDIEMLDFIPAAVLQQMQMQQMMQQQGGGGMPPGAMPPGGPGGPGGQ